MIHVHKFATGSVSIIVIAMSKTRVEYYLLQGQFLHCRRKIVLGSSKKLYSKRCCTKIMTWATFKSLSSSRLDGRAWHHTVCVQTNINTTQSNVRRLCPMSETAASLHFQCCIQKTTLKLKAMEDQRRHTGYKIATFTVRSCSSSLAAKRCLLCACALIT